MRRRTSRAPRRNAAVVAAERHVRTLRADALRAARDRLSGRSDAWLDKRLDEHALNLMGDGLTPSAAATLVVEALEAAAVYQHRRQRPARNRRKR